MKRLMALIIAVVVLGGMIAGCVNVKVPEGPYVSLADDTGSGGGNKFDVKVFEDVLKDAQEDGVITKGQYEELCKRLAKKCGD